MSARSCLSRLLGQESTEVANAKPPVAMSPKAVPVRKQEPAQVAPQERAAETDVSAIWQVGDIILDLYEVKQVFTSGGMGLVYRIHHKGWNIDLAVKSPRPQYFQTEVHRENFIREAETWVDLGLHPHIASCYYVRTLGGIPRIFAEYVEGGSLEDWIDQRKLYEGGSEKTLERILDVAIQFSWGLHYAHEQGLVHQDVKPANVMMTSDGTAKVTDFGLAKARALMEDGDMPGGTRSILVSVGGMTPAYCSPEQAAGSPLSRKTDIWSWGLTVLEMFIGEITWQAGQVAPEALASYLETGPIDSTIPVMPRGVAELLKRCFQREPRKRPANMLEVATTLQEIYQ
jgi:serine/threonine protein kinase